MPASKAFQEWREAERLFREAFEAQSLRIARHETPSPQERAQVLALRARAAALLRLILADVAERALQLEHNDRELTMLPRLKEGSQAGAVKSSGLNAG